MRELPREKLIKYGQKRLSDDELIAVILGTGYKGFDVFKLSKEIIESIQNIKELDDITVDELKKYKGIGTSKALNLLASIELGKRIISYHEDFIYFKNPLDIYKDLYYDVSDLKQEAFYVYYLDIKLKLIAKKRLFLGTSINVQVDAKEILKYALKHSATGIILAHNHPSGDARPSMADKKVTKEIKELSDKLGIFFIDHLIISKNEYYSFDKDEIVKVD